MNVGRFQDRNSVACTFKTISDTRSPPHHRCSVCVCDTWRIKARLQGSCYLRSAGVRKAPGSFPASSHMLNVTSSYLLSDHDHNDKRIEVIQPSTQWLWDLNVAHVVVCESPSSGEWCCKFLQSERTTGGKQEVDVTTWYPSPPLYDACCSERGFGLTVSSLCTRKSRHLYTPLEGVEK